MGRIRILGLTVGMRTSKSSCGQVFIAVWPAWLLVAWNSHSVGVLGLELCCSWVHGGVSLVLWATLIIKWRDLRLLSLSLQKSLVGVELLLAWLSLTWSIHSLELLGELKVVGGAWWLIRARGSSILLLHLL